jgi:hypothetical protein
MTVRLGYLAGVSESNRDSVLMDGQIFTDFLPSGTSTDEWRKRFLVEYWGGRPIVGTHHLPHVRRRPDRS